MIIQDAQTRIHMRDVMMREARKRIGAKYKWAGNGPDYDCSGLVKKVAFKALGINLPRTTQEQWNDGPGKRVVANKLIRGTLYFLAQMHIILTLHM